MERVVRPAIAGALLTAVLLLGSSPPAFAHASLEASTPAANSVLEASPPAIVLDFDAAIEVAVASVELFDGAGNAIAVGSPQPGNDETIVTSALPALADGLYAVTWRVASADGHPIEGSFSFQIGTATVDGSGDDLLARVRSGADHSSDRVQWAYGMARFLSVGGAIALIGVGLWLQGSISRRWWAIASSVFLFGTFAAFALFGAHATGGTLTDALDPSVWREVGSIDTGRALLLRGAFAATLLVLSTRWSHRQHRWWRGAAAVSSVLALATFSLAGHPSSLSPRVLWFAVDFVHLAATVVWIGGLLALLLAPDGQIARRVSTASAVSVPVIVATGIAQAWKLAGGFDDVASTNWGRVLLVKVTLVVILLAVAAVSRWLLLNDGSESIRRTVVVEAMIGVAVIGLAAGMVGLSPTPVVAAQPFAAQLSSSGLIVDVSLGPGVVGGNEVHVIITPPGGSIVPVVAAAARVSLAGDVPVAPVQLVSEGPNHYSGFVAFPQAGEWTLDIIIEVTAGETVLLTATVPIP